MRAYVAFRRRLAAAQRGNAVLFSLIIMASAMTITLGMSSLVVGEVHSVSLVLPAERAYYQSESYVEQALWQKKTNPAYQLASKASLPSNYLCATAGCGPFTYFNKSGQEVVTGQNNAALVEFFATSSPPTTGITFPADITQQYDILTAGANGSGTVTLSNLKGALGYRGLEVTVVAYPTASNQSEQFPVGSPNTPVFIDKIVIPPAEKSHTIQINSAQQNPEGEAYPSLDSNNVYRIRIKALGANASGDVAASSGTSLPLRSPDFTVRSVSQDATSRRGIQVLVPESEHLTSVFDFVLFSDLDLTKLSGKVQGTKLITATAYLDQNRNCVRDASETVMTGLTVTAHPTAGPDLTAQTDSTGTATFSNLQPGISYQVTATLPPGDTACAPGSSQNVSFSGDSSSQVLPVTFLIKP